MKNLNSITIGIIIDEGFCEADIIQVEAVFSLYFRNKIIYIASDKKVVKGKTGLGFVSHESFQTAPKCDILIIASFPKSQHQKALITFLDERISSALYVIAIAKESIPLIESKAVEFNESELVQNDSKSFIQKEKFLITKSSSSAIDAAFYVHQLVRGKVLT